MKRQPYATTFLALTLALAAFAPVGAEARAGSDVWISHRSDGKKGRGTQGDPFDARDQERLDWVMEGIAPNSTIHFGAGTFLTKGIQAKEGWRIRGEGKDRTTIKLAAGVLADSTPGRQSSVVFEYDFQGFLRYFELSDLTIDCNRANQPAFQKNRNGYSLNAWVIAAKSAKITNVRALGTWANPGEGFPCNVYHDGSKNNDDRIEISGCENIDPVGYLTAISAFDQIGGTFAGYIRDCKVINHPKGAAFGSGGWRNFQVANNYTRNASSGMVIDTNSYYHVEIVGNHFYNCSAWAVLYNGGGVYDDISIHDNVFEMSPEAKRPALLTGNAKATTSIFRNTVIQSNPAIPILEAGPHTTATLRDNVIRRRTADPTE